MTLRRVALRTGFDAEFDYWRFKATMAKLFQSYTIPVEMMECNNAKFCSWESATIGAQLHLDSQIHDSIDQAHLVELFINEIHETTMARVALLLNVKFQVITKLYYRLAHLKSTNEPYAISLGVGAMLSELLPEHIRKRVLDVFAVLDIDLDTYLPESVNELDWGS